MGLVYQASLTLRNQHEATRGFINRLAKPPVTLIITPADIARSLYGFSQRKENLLSFPWNGAPAVWSVLAVPGEGEYIELNGIYSNTYPWFF